MSYGLTATTQTLTRTTNLPAASGFSICGWAKHTAFSGSQDTVFYLDTGGGAGDRQLNFNVGPNAFYITDGGGFTAFAYPPISAFWFFWALASTSSTNQGYWAYHPTMAFIKASTSPAAGGATNTLYIGNTGSGEDLNGRLAHVKVWDAVLTETEFRTEMQSVLPIRTRNLNCWSPLRFSAADQSGRGRNWTVGGTPTLLADEPPLPWNANLVVPKSAKTPLPSIANLAWIVG